MNQQNIINLVLTFLVIVLVGTTTFFYARSSSQKIVVPQPTKTTINLASPQVSSASVTPTIPTLTPTPTPPVNKSSAPSTPGQTYVVQLGETLHPIALKYGLSWQDIADVNSISDVNKIIAGQTLVIPKIDTATKSLLVEFVVLEDNLKKIQAQIDAGVDKTRLDPIEVVKIDSTGVFGLNASDNMALEAPIEGQSEALVSVTHADKNYEVKLNKPGKKDSTGIWVISSIGRL